MNQETSGEMIDKRRNKCEVESKEKEVRWNLTETAREKEKK